MTGHCKNCTSFGQLTATGHCWFCDDPTEKIVIPPELLSEEFKIVGSDFCTKCGTKKKWVELLTTKVFCCPKC